MSKAARTFDFSILRTLRRRTKKTIGDISKESGISPAVISKLERNRTSAELDTLYRLGRVFGMSASDLMGLAERRSGQKTQATSYRNGGFSFDRISFGNAVCFHAHARAGAQVARPEVHQDDYEICWLLEGAMKIRLPDETYELAAGDAVQFDAALEHSYEAKENSRMMIVHVGKVRKL